MTTVLDDAPEGTALERAEEASLPTIRPELPDDIDAIANLHRAAFVGTAETALVDAIRRSAYFIPELSVVAELNGQVVGHVLLSRVDLVTESEESVPFLALAPVAVSPMHQGRGFGTLLMRAITALAGARGTEAGIAVLGSPEFFGRFGFRGADEKGITGPWPAPPGVFQVLALQDDVAAGSVTYPTPFSNL